MRVPVRGTVATVGYIVLSKYRYQYPRQPNQAITLFNRYLLFNIYNTKESKLVLVYIQSSSW